MITAKGSHPFPFRTRKLSPSAPMVLPHGGRVGRRQTFFYAQMTSGHLGIKYSQEATTEGEVRTAVAIAARNAPSAKRASAKLVARLQPRIAAYPETRRQTSRAYRSDVVARNDPERRGRGTHRLDRGTACQRPRRYGSMTILIRWDAWEYAD